jgi:hypothetical protein
MKLKNLNLYHGIALLSLRQKMYFIITVALILRIMLFINNPKIFPGDGGAYHNTAVNLVKGNGYSSLPSAPFHYTVFREPAYPVFLAFIYAPVNIFHKIDYVNRDMIKNIYTGYHPEILIAKIIQILLSSFSIVLIFLTIRKFIEDKFSFLISICIAIYIPYAMESVLLLRECFSNFILICVNYFFVIQIINGFKTKHIAITAILIGISILNFQANIILIPFYLLLIFIHTKSLIKVTKYGSLTFLLAIGITLPWTLFVYSKYPDVRIFKTFGMSFTHEMKLYDEYLEYAYAKKIISQTQLHQLTDWGELSQLQFDRSFNGVYQKRVDSLNNIINKYTNNENGFSKNRIGKYFQYFILSTTGIRISNDYNLSRIIKVLLKLSGIIGLMVFFSRTYPMSFVLSSYLAVSWFIGDEQRRVVIIDLFIIVYSLLLIYYLYKSLMTKKLLKPSSVLIIRH